MQEAVTLTEYEPAIEIEVGELVCDAEYYNKVAGAVSWYTPTQGEGRKTVVRVQQVLAADLQLAPISADVKLPPAMHKKKKEQATELGARRLDNHDRDLILDEICRRDALEHDEAVDGSSSESESESESVSEESE